jgi:hypothetical protein
MGRVATLLCFTGMHSLLVESTSSLRHVATSSSIKTETLKDRLPFYHSSSELHEILQEATSSCQGAIATIRQQNADNVALDVVTIKSPQQGPGTKKKALFVFGEHARELVSSESGVHFVRSLCKLDKKAQEVLANTDITVVPNANPMGRQLVESGNFCKRTNENGVDLNRNWGDDHRDVLSVSAANVGSYDDDDRHGGEENPGPRGFSEPETQIIKSLAEELSPDLFLSVHSGSFLMGMPYGFSDHDKPEHADEMARMLDAISQQHFGGNCPYGGIASAIGYRSPGCSVDYAVEHLHVPFAFTFEIYAEKSSSKGLESDMADDQQANSYGFLKKGALQHLSRQPVSESTSLQQPKTQSDQHCLSEFNPMSESVLTQTLESWSSAYLDLAGQVAAAQKGNMHLSAPVHEEHPKSATSASHAETASEYMDMNQAREAVLAQPPSPEESGSVDDDDSEPGSVPWDALKNTNSSWGFMNHKLLPQ